MKPFNLEAAKTGAPVITRDGKKATFIYLENDSQTFYKLFFKIEGNGHPTSYTINGKFKIGYNSVYDLFMLEDSSTESQPYNEQSISGIGLSKPQLPEFKEIDPAERLGYKRGYEEGFIAGSQKEERESKIKEWALQIFISGKITIMQKCVIKATELYDTKIEEKQ